MNKKNIVKYFLDFLMTIVFILMFNKLVLGMAFHEIGGLALGAAIIIHIILNWKWVMGVTKKILSKDLPVKTRIGYILNILLLVCFLIIIIAGIFISKVVFNGLFQTGTMIWKNLHISVSYIALILIGIHVGLHWGWVMNLTKKMCRVEKSHKAVVIISRVLVVLILALGLYNGYNKGVINKITRVFTSATSANGQFPGGGERPDGMERPTDMPSGDMNSGEVPSGEIPSGDMTSGNGANQDLSATTPQKGGKGEKPQDMPTGTDGNKMNSENAQGRPDRGEMPTGGSAEGMPQMQGQSQSIFNVLVTYMSICSVFIILTYYIEKLVVLKKRKVS